MLNAHGDTYHILADTGGSEFFRIELAVCGAGRVTGEGLGIADIDQTQNQLQRVDEARAGFTPSLDTEAENAGCLAVSDFLAGGAVGAVFQAGIVDPLHLRVLV